MASRENARRFHFLREIASGGFGSVYLAKVMHADGFSRLVAIKLLHRRWSENKEIAQRMRDEARLLGWLRHRNIVDVIDLTSIDGRAAVIMEYLDAVDLKTVVQTLAERGERMPPYAALEAVAFVASALDAAYNRPPYEGEKPLRVIHRDIKPSNIMVDESGTVKVLDFGVARGEFENRESHTQELQFGSVEYMPPERLFFEPETDRADVYSLGASLFELLTGERLGKAKGRAEKHAAFLEDRLSFLAASCPLPNPQGGEMARLIREMCSYNADNRPKAEEVVSRARTLARQMPGPALNEWAEVVVKPLVADARRAPREPNPLTDSVLSEDSTVFAIGEGLDARLEVSTVSGAEPAPSGAPPAGGDVPREDLRWEMLRKAALAELGAQPPPLEEDEFGDEPTRIGIDVGSIPGAAPAPPARPVTPAAPPSGVSAPMPRALAASPAPKPAAPKAPPAAPPPGATSAPMPRSVAPAPVDAPKPAPPKAAPPKASLPPGAVSAPMPRALAPSAPAAPAPAAPAPAAPPSAAAPEPPTVVPAPPAPAPPAALPVAPAAEPTLSPAVEPPAPTPTPAAAAPPAPAPVLPPAPVRLLPEIKPGDLDPPSAEALKPVLGAAPTMIPDADAPPSEEEVIAGLARLRANLTMVPPDDAEEEPPTTAVPTRSRPDPGNMTFPILAGPSGLDESPPRPAKAPKPAPAPAVAPAPSPVAAAPKPTPKPVPVPSAGVATAPRPPPRAPEPPVEEPSGGSSGVLLVVAVLALGVLGGLVIGGGFLAWQYYQATQVAVVSPPPATTPATPAAPAPGASPAAVLAAPSAGPDDLVFVSAAADTRSVSVDCGGKSASGAGEVIVPGPVTGPCLVTLVKKDRSRIRAEVKEPSAGRWSCFTADAEACSK